MSNMESQFQELDRRIGQIEEYNRSRGQSEIMRMENLMNSEMKWPACVEKWKCCSMISIRPAQEMGRAADADFRMLWLRIVPMRWNRPWEWDRPLHRT